MRRLIYRFYGWLERAIFPGLRYSQNHYHELLKRQVPAGCDWADLGCGHQMFAEWMVPEQNELAARARLIVGLDLDWEGLRRNPYVHHKIFGNLEAVPLPSERFDLMTANMVVEHLERPAGVLAEVRRVLRPGGSFVFHTPNRQCAVIRVSNWLPQGVKNLAALLLEGRQAEDVFPTHYQMNTPADVRRLAAEAGFEVERIQTVSSSAITALLGPVAAIELLYLRWIDRPQYENLRSNMLVVLRRPKA